MHAQDIELYLSQLGMPLDLALYGIRVNALVPGAIDT